jgi:hypothetical protein
MARDDASIEIAVIAIKPARVGLPPARLRRLAREGQPRSEAPSMMQSVDFPWWRGRSRNSNPLSYSTPLAWKAALAAGVARNFTNAAAPSRSAGAAEGAAA